MHTLQIKSARLLDIYFPALLILLALAIAYPRWRAGIDWRDEGLLAYGAARVMAGDIPHRDFVSLQPPLSYYTSAAMFNVFGTSLATLRILGLAIFLILPLLIYGIGRNFMGAVVSFAAAVPVCLLGLPYVYFVPLAAWQGIAASLAAVLVLVTSLSTRPFLAFPAGLLTAISLSFRHDQGLYTTASLVALIFAMIFVRDGSMGTPKLKQSLLWWVSGIGIALIPALILYWKWGALPEMYRQLIVFPFATYRKTSALPFPRFGAAKTAADTLVVLLFYLPAVVQTIAAIFLGQSLFRRRFGRREAALMFLMVWSFLVYMQVMTRSDQTHLWMTLAPFFLLTAYLWSIMLETISNRLWIGRLLSVGCAILLGCYLWMLRSVALPNVTDATERLTLPRGGVRIAQPQVVENFVRNLQTYVPPTRSILAIPYQPMFYFLCERRNPTRWNYLWPGDQTTSDQDQFVAEAERDPPAVVLLSQQRELSEYAPTIVDYVDAHYVRTGNLGGLTVYLRRE